MTGGLPSSLKKKRKESPKTATSPKIKRKTENIFFTGFTSKIYNFPMGQNTLIVNRKAFLKILLVLIFLSTSGFGLPDKMREKLSRLPFFGRYFSPPSPPFELKKKAKKAIEEAYWEGAPFYAPEPFDKAKRFFEKGEKALAIKNYPHARYYFHKALEEANQAKEKTLAQRKKLKEESQKKFDRVLKRWQEAQIPPEERLKWELRLRYLKELLRQERYQEFLRAAEEAEKELLKKERKPGQASPPPISGKT